VYGVTTELNVASLDQLQHAIPEFAIAGQNASGWTRNHSSLFRFYLVSPPVKLIFHATANGLPMSATPILFCGEAGSTVPKKCS
jgi:hypothetical protein